MPRSVTESLLTQRRTTVVSLTTATAVMLAGFVSARLQYPGGFDWEYTVISSLGSRKHNPDGAPWFAGALALTVILLAPVVRRLWVTTDPGDRPSRLFVQFLTAGMVGALLVGVEWLSAVQLASMLRKGHEILALLTLLCLYIGVLGLLIRRTQRDRYLLWPTLGVLVPIVGIGIAALMLYFDQRSLGWVNQDWRKMGIPLWMSFAFWQWLAVGGLWLGLSGLALLPARRRARVVQVA